MFSILFAAALSTSQIQTIESTVQQGMTERQIPSAVVRVDIDGKNEYSRAFGNADIAEHQAATEQTRYQYGSITKQFTAAAILSLAGDGKLSIDDRLGKWLPEFSKFPVTIRQLLVHSGGLADFADEPWYFEKDMFNPIVGSAQLLKWSAAQRLRFAPGSQAKYNNAGYTILARIVEKASGKQYFDFLSERFLKPLRMDSVHAFSYFAIRPVAKGYIFSNSLPSVTPGLPEGVSLVQALPWNLNQVDGAGTLVGEAADLQKWDNALLEHRVLTGEAEKWFYTEGRLNNGKPTYTGPENPSSLTKPAVYLLGGLGSFDIDGVQVYGANGGTLGFQSFTATVPSKRISVTILTNHGTDIDNAKLTNPILRALIH